MMELEIDPQDLASAGWALIVPETAKADFTKAVDPLLKLRSEQTAGKFGVLDYRPGEDSRAFLGRHGGGESLPFYLLLAGSPEVASYDFQNELSLRFAVGRIDFETADELAAYASSVVGAESRSEPGPLSVTIFCADAVNDPSMAGASEHLARPLSEKLGQKRSGATARVIAGHDATRAALAEAMQAAPRILIAMASGIGFPPGHPLQRDHQGGLLCYGAEDTTGVGRVPRECWFSADDVPSGADLSGTIGVLIGSFTAGTPRVDSLGVQILGEEKLNSPSAFAARLSQKLLANPGGGALAMFGCADRIAVFGPPERRWAKLQTSVQECVLRLVRGDRAGYVLGQVKRPWAALATDLSGELERANSGQSVDANVADLWGRVNMARSFVLVGDPAVRLR